MALRAEFTLHHSEFGDFLSAPIWEERNGSPLSVLSALSRLDVDPWQEAARLADLPRDGAAVALAALLARLPRNGLELPDDATLARRLITYLPERVSTASPGRHTSGFPNIGTKALGVILALASALVVLAMNGWLV